MNWGLFIGGKVMFGNQTFVLSEAGRGHLHFEGFGNMRFDSKDCKPILRPLSSMTEEEKDEIKERFYDRAFRIVGLEYVSFKDVSDNHIDLIVEWYEGGMACRSAIQSPEIILWLIERRFYVGQCKLSECIIEEV